MWSDVKVDNTQSKRGKWCIIPSRNDLICLAFKVKCWSRVSWNPILMHGEKHLWWGWSRIWTYGRIRQKRISASEGNAQRSCVSAYPAEGTVLRQGQRQQRTERFGCQQHTWATSGIAAGLRWSCSFPSFPVRSGEERGGGRQNSPGQSEWLLALQFHLLLLLLLCPLPTKLCWAPKAEGSDPAPTALHTHGQLLSLLSLLSAALSTFIPAIMYWTLLSALPQ